MKQTFLNILKLNQKALKVQHQAQWSVTGVDSSQVMLEPSVRPRKPSASVVRSKETVNKSWIHYASMAFEDDPNKNRQKQTFVNLTA